MYSASAVSGPITMYENNSVLLGAQITPNGAAQDYTLEADSDDVQITLTKKNKIMQLF